MADIARPRPHHPTFPVQPLQPRHDRTNQRPELRVKTLQRLDSTKSSAPSPSATTFPTPQSVITPPLTPQSSFESNPSPDAKSFPTFLRAFYPYHPDGPLSSDDSQSSITLPISRGDIILVHSVQPNGWADGSLLRNGSRGWLPTNYCETYDNDMMRNLLKALTNVWDFLRGHEEGDLSIFRSQDYVRGMIGGVRMLLEQCGCLSRDSEAVVDQHSIRALRKALLADLSAFAKKAKSVQEACRDEDQKSRNTCNENSEVGGEEQYSYACLERREWVCGMLDEILLKAMKVVTRAVRFLDFWQRTWNVKQKAEKGVDARDDGVGGEKRLPREPLGTAPEPSPTVSATSLPTAAGPASHTPRSQPQFSRLAAEAVPSPQPNTTCASDRSGHARHAQVTLPKVLLPRSTDSISDDRTSERNAPWQESASHSAPDRRSCSIEPSCLSPVSDSDSTAAGSEGVYLPHPVGSDPLNPDCLLPCNNLAEANAATQAWSEPCVARHKLSCPTAAKRASASHRLSHTVRTPSPSSNHELISDRLCATHEAFLGFLGTFIGLHMESRRTMELLFTTQQSVRACESLLNVVQEIWERDFRRSEAIDESRMAMHSRLAELVNATRDIFQAAGVAGDDDEAVCLPEQSKRLVEAATACVRSAGDCVTKSHGAIERTGNFEVEINRAYRLEQAAKVSRASEGEAQEASPLSPHSKPPSTAVPIVSTATAAPVPAPSLKTPLPVTSRFSTATAIATNPTLTASPHHDDKNKHAEGRRPRPRRSSSAKPLPPDPSPSRRRAPTPSTSVPEFQSPLRPPPQPTFIRSTSADQDLPTLGASKVRSSLMRTNTIQRKASETGLRRAGTRAVRATGSGSNLPTLDTPSPAPATSTEPSPDDSSSTSTLHPRNMGSASSLPVLGTPPKRPSTAHAGSNSYSHPRGLHAASNLPRINTTQANLYPTLDVDIPRTSFFDMSNTPTTSSPEDQLTVAPSTRPPLSLQNTPDTAMMPPSAASRFERFNSGDDSNADSSETPNSSARHSGGSTQSRVSTRATTPDQQEHKLSEDSSWHVSISSFDDDSTKDNEMESQLLVETHVNELTFNAEGQVTGGSLPALIERLTAHDTTPDALFVNTFYLTFRSFTTPGELAQALIDRFERAGDDPEQGMPVRLRVYNVFKSWMEAYWNLEADGEALKLIIGFANGRLRFDLPTASRRLLELSLHVCDMASQPNSPNSPKVIQNGFARPRALSGANPSPEAVAPNPNISKGQLNALKVMKNGVSACNLLDLNALELARQFTIMQSKLFSAIQPEELLGLEWTKKADSKAVNVKAMISLSTDLANLVADTILSLELKKRAVMIKHWVKIATKCLELSNYDALMAIISSLNSSIVLRLKKTWELVSPKTLGKLDYLKTVVDVSRNYFVLRQRLQGHIAPCLPFVGIYLTDLTFIDCGNQPTRQLSSGGTTQTVINFDKYVKITKVIGDLQRFQVPYKLTAVPEMQDWMESQIKRVREAEQTNNVQNFYRRSLMLEPRENSAPPSVHKSLSAESSASTLTSQQSKESHKEGNKFEFWSGLGLSLNKDKAHG